MGDENDTWVVVLTGAGRGFCSGLDLKDYGILPGIDRAVGQNLVDGAHRRCPYSKAVRGNINVVTNVV